MGQYKEIKGDMLEMFDKGDFHIIAHGCNCYATFGTGIALTIGKKYPEAMEADRNNPTRKGLPRLGNYAKADRFIQIANRTIGRTIIFLYNYLR